MVRPVINTTIAGVLEGGSWTYANTRSNFPDFKSHDKDRRRTLNEDGWNAEDEIAFLGYNREDNVTYTVLKNGVVFRRQGRRKSFSGLAWYLPNSSEAAAVIPKPLDASSIRELITVQDLTAEWWAYDLFPKWHAGCSSETVGDSVKDTSHDPSSERPLTRAV